LRNELFKVIERGYDSKIDDDEFNDIALSIHKFQVEHCPVIRRLSPEKINNWLDIPLVPVSLFASRIISSFPIPECSHYFESSGTTGDLRSRHYFYELSLYKKASLSGAVWAVRNQKFRIQSLWEDRPYSSLSCMINWMRDSDDLVAETELSPVLLIGAAFNFVTLIERGKSFELPRGSVVIETGGYKGRTREFSREELYSMISENFKVPVDSIISEYGMCEISTPLWERIDDARGFHIPPWVKIRILDPDNLEDSDKGVIAIYDLANINSSIGILTADTGYLQNGRLFFEGRVRGVTDKGCSTTVLGS